jgi:hypothetical protein
MPGTPQIHTRHEMILTSNAKDTKRQSFGIIHGAIVADEILDRDGNPKWL